MSKFTRELRIRKPAVPSQRSCQFFSDAFSDCAVFVKESKIHSSLRQAELALFPRACRRTKSQETLRGPHRREVRERLGSFELLAEP